AIATSLKRGVNERKTAVRTQDSFNGKRRIDYPDAVAGALSDRRWAQRHFCLAGVAQTSRAPVIAGARSVDQAVARLSGLDRCAGGSRFRWEREKSRGDFRSRRCADFLFAQWAISRCHH